MKSAQPAGHSGRLLVLVKRGIPIIAGGTAAIAVTWFVGRSWRDAPGAPTPTRITASTTHFGGAVKISPNLAPSVAPASERHAAPVAGSKADFAALRERLTAAMARDAGPQRARALQEIAVDVAVENPAWGYTLLGELEDVRSRLTFTRALVEKLAADRPLAAAAWIEQLSDATLREAACNVAAMTWAETDLERARSWALGLEDAAARASAVEGIAWTWAQKDPRALYEWAVGLDDATLREQVLVKTAKVLAAQNPRQAVEWASQFPEGAQREQALHYAIFQWAAQDLGATTEWTAHVADPALRAIGELAIARSWSTQEAEGATTWAATIADPEARAMALKTTLRKWAETNPGEAAAWIAQREPTPANKDVFLNVTKALGDAHPDALTIWLNTIKNPEWRELAASMLGTEASRPEPRRIPGG